MRSGSCGLLANERVDRDGAAEQGIARGVGVKAIGPQVGHPLCRVRGIAQHRIEVEHRIERAAGLDPVMLSSP
jgi:hypothetical protein